ncbi:MAG: regulatory protein RecX [Selenomonadaceae bacterium]|nr:regulatory protein RecX [Selenomonadaceae bacterium]
MREQNKTALMKAAELLARREQSSKNLRQKLLSKKYSESETDAAIKTLQERNYLNDEETCARQFEILYSEEKFSVRQICMKLIQRGFDSSFVKNLIPADSDSHDKKVAEKILEKKIRTINFDELDAKEIFKTKSKLYQNLAAKGFNSEVISAAMENFLLTEK